MSEIKSLTKDLEEFQEELKCVQTRLYQAQEELEEAECEVDRYEEKEYDLEKEIKRIEKAIMKIKGLIKCPQCNSTYLKSNMDNQMGVDIWGDFWKCPAYGCDFKGYKNKFGFYVSAQKLNKERKEDFNKNQLVYFRRIDDFISNHI